MVDFTTNNTNIEGSNPAGPRRENMSRKKFSKWPNYIF
jgi:hypothetical protein